MILYGMKIDSDIDFDLKLPYDSEYKDTITICKNVPLELKNSLTCGTYLYTTSKHKVYLYSDQDISSPLKTNQPLCYEADGLVKFYWYHKDKSIYYELLHKDTDKFSFWFIHHFFSFFLSIEEYFVMIHGSAVEIEDKSILFLAPYKSGKSTLANYIVHQGHKLITDDILATFIKDNNIYYTPSHPYSNPFEKGRYLGTYMRSHKKSFDTLDQVYIIQNSSENTDINIKHIKGLEKFQLVRKNSLLYSMPYIRVNHEKHLGILLNSVDFFILSYPWGKEHLPQIYQALQNNLKYYSQSLGDGGTSESAYIDVGLIN